MLLRGATNDGPGCKQVFSLVQREDVEGHHHGAPLGDPNVCRVSIDVITGACRRSRGTPFDHNRVHLDVRTMVIDRSLSTS